MIDNIKELFDYRDGCLVWRVNHNSRARKGDIAGYLDRSLGYWRIRVDGRKYGRSRLVWLHQKGEWPPDEMDHIDRNRSNDRIENLRLSTRGQNSRNTKARSASGFKGVYSNRGRWIASVRFNGKYHHIGLFYNKKEANVAATAFRLKLDPVFYAEN